MKQPVVNERFDPSKAGGGFNPYDNSAARSGRSSDPFRAVRSRQEPASQAPTRKSGARSKPAPTEVRKLSGWLKLKRALTGKA